MEETAIFRAVMHHASCVEEGGEGIVCYDSLWWTFSGITELFCPSELECLGSNFVVTRQAHVSLAEMLFLSSSQGYGKPVGSDLCSFFSWRRELTAGFIGSAKAWSGVLSLQGFRSQSVVVCVAKYPGGESEQW